MKAVLSAKRATYGVLILIGKEIVLKTISNRSDTVSRFESEGRRH